MGLRQIGVVLLVIAVALGTADSVDDGGEIVMLGESGAASSHTHLPLCARHTP